MYLGEAAEDGFGEVGGVGRLQHLREEEGGVSRSGSRSHWRQQGRAAGASSCRGVTVQRPASSAAAAGSVGAP